MVRAASSERLASVGRMPRSSGKATRPSAAQIVGAARVVPLTDRAHAGDGGERRAPLLEVARLVEVGDALLGDDVADVVAVDHDRGDRHARGPAHGHGVELLDEGRHAALLVGLGHLHHELAAARDRARRPRCSG